MKWFKSSRTVENPAQAGDAALALYHQKFKKKSKLFIGIEDKVLGVVTVHTQEKDLPDFTCKLYNHHRKYELEFWGVPKGIVQIPLIKLGSLYESMYAAIWALNFSNEDMQLFTHVIIKAPYLFSLPKNLQRTDKEEVVAVDIYRLNNVERHCIVNKTIF